MSLGLFSSIAEQPSPDNGTYQKEISHMMHGFGDNASPNPSTVVLVESIVAHQMRLILQEAAKNSERRGHKSIHPEDIIFLMRNNRIKLQRMLLFMKSKASLRNKSKVLTDAYVPVNLLEEDCESNSRKRKKSFSEIVDFLDETGDLSKCLDFDAIKNERMLRANKISQSMPAESYEAYHKARCVSFGSSVSKSGGHAKLKQWLNPANDVNIAFQTFDLLSYLCNETVAQIVDLSLLVRQDSKGMMNDPFAKLEGGHYLNPANVSGGSLSSSGQEGVPAITVAEVREAMRRFSTPRVRAQGLFYRNIQNELPIKFLAM